MVSRHIIQTMTSHTDTIVSISSPPGQGAIALIRMSGPDAFSILSKRWKGRDLTSLKSHTAHLGTLTDSDGKPLDQALVTIFRAPASFTGEKIAEIAIHGSRWIQKTVVETLVEAGARPALPGEFSQRAFLNHKIDLAQAEGIADLIASDSRAAHTIALTQASGRFSHEINALRDQLIHLASLLELELDFSEEDVTFADRQNLLSLTQTLQATIRRLTDSFRQGKAFKEGIPVAIMGAPNAGKSTLLNALLREDKAIVTDIPGTTRDIIEETLEIQGIRFRLIDTAGLRETEDTIERIGISRAKDAAARAAIILRLTPVDHQGQVPTDIVHSPHTTIIDVRTKTDLCPLHTHSLLDNGCAHISAKTGDGIDELRQLLASTARSKYNPDTDLIITNARHHSTLEKAGESLGRVEEGLRGGIPTDLIAEDLRHSIHYLSELTGQIPPDLLLENIFRSFCIGK